MADTSKYTISLSAPATLTATLGAGKINVNDYTLAVEEVENGVKLTLTRGSKTETLFIPNGAKGDKGDKGDPGSDASVTAENIEAALGYVPVNPTALDAKQDVLTEADKQAITKAGMTSGAAWTAAEQKAARDRMGIAGFAEMKHITTLVIEEETNVVIVDLGKQCKICRFYYTFPETISTGYTYVEVSNANTQFYNISGCSIGNKQYLDYIRIASALKPISIFAPAAYIGNESTVNLMYSMPMSYAMDETTGFRYLRFTTYQMKFPKNTTIEVYAV